MRKRLQRSPGVRTEAEILQEAKDTEFSHFHIQINRDTCVIRVLGKGPVVVNSVEELNETINYWVKHVRQKNWGVK
jgi:hypothetical protein